MDLLFAMGFRGFVCAAEGSVDTDELGYYVAVAVVAIVVAAGFGVPQQGANWTIPLLQTVVLSTASVRFNYCLSISDTVLVQSRCIDPELLIISSSLQRIDPNQNISSSPYHYYLHFQQKNTSSLSFPTITFILQRKCPVSKQQLTLTKI